MTHPLTDEMCYGMRVGYSSAESMRAAADWQLEQVIRWLDEQGYYFVETDGEGNFLDDPEPNTELLYRLKKTMRPQEES